MKSFRFQRTAGWCEAARVFQEITPEQAAELFEVSRPGFFPLQKGALLDAQEIPPFWR